MYRKCCSCGVSVRKATPPSVESAIRSPLGHPSTPPSPVPVSRGRGGVLLLPAPVRRIRIGAAIARSATGVIGRHAPPASIMSFGARLRKLCCVSVFFLLGPFLFASWRVGVPPSSKSCVEEGFDVTGAQSWVQVGYFGCMG
jgi:hypothetical protein